MDSGLHQVTERGIDHPLSFDTALSDECRTLNAKRKVAFAGRIVAAVAAMLLTIVDELDRGW